MMPYDYIWLFKSIIILAGLITLFAGYRVVKKELRDKYSLAMEFGENRFQISGGSLGILVMILGIILSLGPFQVTIHFEYEVVGEAREIIGKPSYIYLLQVLVACYGIFILILGYRLLKEEYKDPYEIESKLWKFSFKLNATSLGIFVMMLGVLLVLSPLIIEPDFKYELGTRPIEKTVIKAPPIVDPPVFKKKN
jgi:hypothetical protein